MYDNDWFKEIKEIRFAPGFDPKDQSVLNDIALIELQRPFEPRYLKPACFPYKEKAYNYTGDPLLVSLFARLIGFYTYLLTNRLGHRVGVHRGSVI